MEDKSRGGRIWKLENGIQIIEYGKIRIWSSDYGMGLGEFGVGTTVSS